MARNSEAEYIQGTYEDLVQNGWADVDLGYINYIQGEDAVKADTEACARMTGKLLTLLGIAPETWAQFATRVTINDREYEPEEVIPATVKGQELQLGAYMIDATLEAIRFEDGDEAPDSQVDVNLLLPGGRLLNVHGWGYFTTDRLFQHPYTGKLYDDVDDGDERMWIEAYEGVELECIDSTTDTRVVVSARLSLVQLEPQTAGTTQSDSV